VAFIDVVAAMEDEEAEDPNRNPKLAAAFDSILPDVNISSGFALISFVNEEVTMITSSALSASSLITRYMICLREGCKDNS
jgi:hypothetical protein